MSEKLNLGSGALPLPGYRNIDRTFDFAAIPNELHGACFPGDVYPLDPATGASVIRASHVLEHFSHRETLDVLKSWVAALAPGGVLKIAVPDFDKITDWYISGHGKDIPLEQYLFGGHVDGNDRHGALFTKDKLTALMRMAGLGDVRPWKSDLQDCASLPVSLNLMGTKGAAEYPNLSGIVAACFSMPRLAFTDNMFCAMKAFTKLQIPALRKGGVFWGQCLQGVMELTLERGPKYLLTVDYDTVFTPDDVLALYRLMEDNPHVGAVCAMQSGRDRATPLMTVADADGKNRQMLAPEEVAVDLLELRTGHFGLTLIRAELLTAMPKPWFEEKPDAKGSWGEGRVDADIAFWIKFAASGGRLFQANRVVVGHMQQMISFPGQSMETIHQYASEYETQGKPDNVWR